MAVEGKYGRVVVERGSIGADEPVFLFRAQDRLTPDVLRGYIELCLAAGSSAHHVEGVRRDLAVIEEWQRSHLIKTPGVSGAGTDRGSDGSGGTAD